MPCYLTGDCTVYIAATLIVLTKEIICDPSTPCFILSWQTGHHYDDHHHHNKLFVYWMMHKYLMTNLFINSISKSVYKSSFNGYRNSQRTSNLALSNRQPVTKIVPTVPLYFTLNPLYVIISLSVLLTAHNIRTHKYGTSLEHTRIINKNMHTTQLQFQARNIINLTHINLLAPEFYI
jgi:hypothetical protein